GVVWAGRPQHTNDRNRSVPLPQLLALLRKPGIRFVGLQKGQGTDQVGQLPDGIDLLNVGDALNDFTDTAACLAHMDLVVTVDTAVAHLAGAMGRPVWMLVPFIPDWRWGMDGMRTPWYPTMRLFRQPKLKDWATVVDRMARALPAALGLGATPDSESERP
ncbi:MAG: hypothetical protein KJP07_12520, partial [Desulfatitalea sp.]|nr:hypothetical protein [Desulfatitalea sp.]